MHRAPSSNAAAQAPFQQSRIAVSSAFFCLLLLLLWWFDCIIVIFHLLLCASQSILCTNISKSTSYSCQQQPQPQPISNTPLNDYMVIVMEDEKKHFINYDTDILSWMNCWRNRIQTKGKLKKAFARLVFHRPTSTLWTVNGTFRAANN